MTRDQLVKELRMRSDTADGGEPTLSAAADMLEADRALLAAVAACPRVAHDGLGLLPRVPADLWRRVREAVS